MIYYFVLTLPFLFMFTRLLLTNFLIPHFKKKSFYKEIQKRFDWPFIEKTEHTLKTIFKGAYTKITSIIYLSGPLKGL